LSRSSISKVHIKLFEGQNIKLSNRLLRTPLVCSLRLINGSDSSKSFSFKSHPKKCNDDFIISWDQNFTLSPVSPEDTLLHVRVFEFHMIKDLFICEVYIPLSFLFSKVSKAAESIEVDAIHNTEDILTERKEANDIVEDSSRSSPNSIEGPELGSLGGGTDIMNDHVEIDRNVNTKVVERKVSEVVDGGKEIASVVSKMTPIKTPILPSVVVELSNGNDVNSHTSVPLEDISIATPEVISDGDCNLSGMNFNNNFGVKKCGSGEKTKKSEKVKEIVKGQGKEKHNLFSWLSLTGALRGQSSNNLENHNDVDLSPAQNENTPITSAFKNIFKAASPPTRKKIETGDIVDNVNTLTPLGCAMTAVKPLPMIIGKETVSCYKCYGRGAGVQEVEKGEICLGLSLETSPSDQ
jgi:hypothetical protein